jgi:hypothetical protein
MNISPVFATSDLQIAYSQSHLSEAHPSLVRRAKTQFSNLVRLRAKTDDEHDVPQLGVIILGALAK